MTCPLLITEVGSVSPFHEESKERQHFCSAAPRIWNSLPLNLRSSDLVFVPQNSISSQNLSHVTGFQGLIWLRLVFLRFGFGLTVPWTPGRVDMCALSLYNYYYYLFFSIMANIQWMISSSDLCIAKYFDWTDFVHSECQYWVASNVFWVATCTFCVAFFSAIQGK